MAGHRLDCSAPAAYGPTGRPGLGIGETSDILVARLTATSAHPDPARERTQAPLIGLGLTDWESTMGGQGKAKIVDRLRSWRGTSGDLAVAGHHLFPHPTQLWRATDHNPIEASRRSRPTRSSLPDGEMALQSRIDTAFRRLHDYLKNDDSWGPCTRAACEVAAGRLLRWSSAQYRELAADLPGRPGRAGGDYLKSRQRTWASRSSGSTSTTRVFRQSPDDKGYSRSRPTCGQPDLLLIEPVRRGRRRA